jgi:hypothetical protein
VRRNLELGREGKNYLIFRWRRRGVPLEIGGEKENSLELGLDTDIAIAPDNLHICTVRHTPHSFNNVYQLLQLLTLTSKIGETAFQEVNRMVWTDNKAYKIQNETGS